MALNRHHKNALRTIGMAAMLNGVLGVSFGLADGCGIWNGLYFSTTTASTVGYGDITPRGWLPHILAAVIMLTVLPLLSATYTLITAGLTADHIDLRHEQVKQHVTDTLGGRQ